MSRFEQLRMFITVVEQGSFSRAAEILEISRSHVSRSISALEDELGARLIYRTTRSASVTEVGEAYYQRARQILEDMETADQEVMQLHGTPRGLLRVSMPMTFGLRHIAPLIFEFLERYPDLEADLDFSDRRVDMIEEGFDMVVRIGVLQESSFVVRKLGRSRRHLFASPAYLKKHGRPQHPRELEKHSCLEYTYQTAPSWLLSRGTEEQSVQPSARLRANNGEALTSAAISGLGIILMPDFIARKHLDNKELEVVLPGWTDDAGGVWAVYPQNRHLSAKTRVLRDFLVEKFKSEPWLLETSPEVM